MYKLLYRNLAKSTKSPTNYKNIYRRLTQRNNNCSQNKFRKSNSPTLQQININEEVCEEMLHNSKQIVQNNSRTTFFTKRNMKMLQTSSGHSQCSMLSSYSLKKKFYSSILDLRKYKNFCTKVTDSPFKNFNNNGKQQTDRKSKNKKLTSRISQPLQQKQSNTNTPQSKGIKLKQWTFQESNVNFWGRHDQNPKVFVKKANIMGKQKFKIVYPGNTKSKMSFHQKFKKNKRYISFAQEKVRNFGIPVTPEIIKKKVSTPKVNFNVNFSPTPIKNEKHFPDNLHITENSHKPLHVITDHPLLKKADYQNKMSIKKKYNFLLLKHDKRVAITKPESVVGNREIENPQMIQSEKANHLNHTQEVQHGNGNSSEQSVLQHPIQSHTLKSDLNKTLKYPKGVVSEKYGSFDVEDICWKNKEKYLPSDSTRKMKILFTTTHKKESEKNKSKEPQSDQIKFSSEQQVQNRASTKEKPEIKTRQDKFPAKHVIPPKLLSNLDTVPDVKERKPLKRSHFNNGKSMNTKLQMSEEKREFVNTNKQIKPISKQNHYTSKNTESLQNNDNKVNDGLCKQSKEQLGNEKKSAAKPIQHLNHMRTILNQYKFKVNMQKECARKNNNSDYINFKVPIKPKVTSEHSSIEKYSSSKLINNRLGDKTLETDSKYLCDNFKKHDTKSINISKMDGKNNFKEINGQLKDISLVTKIEGMGTPATEKPRDAHPINIDTKSNMKIEKQEVLNWNKQTQISKQYQNLEAPIQSVDKNNMTDALLIKEKLSQLIKRKKSLTKNSQQINHMQKHINQNKSEVHIDKEDNQKNNYSDQKMNTTTKDNTIKNYELSSKIISGRKNDSENEKFLITNSNKQKTKSMEITEGEGKRQWKEIKELLKKITLVIKFDRTEVFKKESTNTHSKIIHDTKDSQIQTTHGIKIITPISFNHIDTASHVQINESKNQPKKSEHTRQINFNTKHQKINETQIAEMKKKLKNLRKILDDRWADKSTKNSIENSSSKTILALDWYNVQPELSHLNKENETKLEKMLTIRPHELKKIKKLYMALPVLERRKGELLNTVRGSDKFTNITSKRQKIDNEEGTTLNNYAKEDKISKIEDSTKKNIQTLSNTVIETSVKHNDVITSSKKQNIYPIIPNKEIISFQKSVSETNNKSNLETYLAENKKNSLNQNNRQKYKEHGVYVIPWLTKLTIDYKKNIRNHFEYFDPALKNIKNDPFYANKYNNNKFERGVEKNAVDDIKMLKRRSNLLIFSNDIKENHSFITCNEGNKVTKSDTSISYNHALNFPNTEVDKNKVMKSFEKTKQEHEDGMPAINDFSKQKCSEEHKASKRKLSITELDKMQSEYELLYKIKESIKTFSNHNLRMKFITPIQQNNISENKIKLNRKNKIVHFDKPKPNYSFDFDIKNEIKDTSAEANIEYKKRQKHQYSLGTGNSKHGTKFSRRIFQFGFEQSLNKQNRNNSNSKPQNNL